MSNPAQPEPSMEEILASIRRIISEDPATAPAAPQSAPVEVVPAQVVAEASPPPPPPQPVAPPPAVSAVDDSVFDLTPDMRTQPYVPPAPEPVSIPEPEPEPVSYVPEPPAMSYDNPEGDSIMSPQTEAAAAAALASFASGLTSRHGFEGATVEGVVRELLRPMLREWMDANLPTLVERLVEAEIERLSRRRG